MNIISRHKLLAIFKICLPGLLLAGVVVLVFLVDIAFKQRTFFALLDNGSEFYPWYQKITVAIHHGTLPIWDPNVSSGRSFVGEMQAGVFYPINLVWVWLFGSAQGISTAWLELLLVLHFWIAALGAYLFARSLGLRKSGSFAVAIMFAFGGAVTMRSVQMVSTFFGLCYIPWVLYAYNQWITYKLRRLLVLCGAFLGLILLAGHVQPWFHACVILGLFVVLRNPSLSFGPWVRVLAKRLLAVVVAIAISFVVAAPQVVLSAQYLPLALRYIGEPDPVEASARISYVTFTKTFSYAPEQLFSVIDPVTYPVSDSNEIYIGLIGIGIVLATLIFCRKQLRTHPVWRLYKYFIVIGSALALLIMIGYWTFLSEALRVMPFLSQVRQLARYSIIIHLALALFIGICIEILPRRVPDILRNKKIAVAAVALTVFLAINTVYLYFAQVKGVIFIHFVYQNAILVIALAGSIILRRHAKWVLLAGLVLFAIAQPTWFLPKVANQLRYPPSYYRRSPAITFLEQHYGTARVVLQDDALPNNIGDVYKIQTVNGYQATVQKEFYNYWKEPDPAGKLEYHVSLMNVTYVASKLKREESPLLKLVLHDTDRNIYVYQRADYSPRAYFASQTDACIYHQAICTPPQILSYSDTHIRLQSNSDQQERVVLSEMNYPGWRAYVDGKATPSTSYAPITLPIFRSVAVPAGKHVIDFRYQPFPF